MTSEEIRAIEKKLVNGDPVIDTIPTLDHVAVRALMAAEIALQLAITNEREAARHNLLLEPAAIALLEARRDERHRAWSEGCHDVERSIAHNERLLELNREIAKLKNRGQRSEDKNDE